MRAVFGGFLLLAVIGEMPLAAAEPRLQRIDSDQITAAEQAALSKENEKAGLSCHVTVVKPQMRLDLGFHTGYVVTVPLKQLAGEGNRLHALAKVTPDDRSAGPVYFATEIPVPPIGPEASGDVELPGDFIVGPGRYRVDWTIRDESGRSCSKDWDIKAKLRKNFPVHLLAVPANSVREVSNDSFAALPAKSLDGGPLHVRVLVNFAPGDPNGSALTSRDVRALTAILRAVAREPRFGRFSVVAFSSSQQRVFHTQDAASEIDFPALGEAVEELQTGTISFAQLRDPNSATRFLGAVLRNNLTGQPPVDAVVIVSPQVMLDDKPSKELFASVTPESPPVFYLNYNPDPISNPWRDTIAGVLKIVRGLQYSITRPRDLGSALRDMQSRLLRSDASSN